MFEVFVYWWIFSEQNTKTMETKKAAWMNINTEVIRDSRTKIQDREISRDVEKQLSGLSEIRPWFLIWQLGTISHRLWAYNTNFVKNNHVALIKINQIRLQFCTYHDSSAIVTYANLWPDCIMRILNKTKLISQDFNDYLINKLFNGSLESYEAAVACKPILGVSPSFVLMPKIFIRLSVVCYLLVKNKIYFVSNDICKQSCLFDVVVFVMLSIILMSYWARWRLKSPASRLFTQPSIQAQIKENIKAPRHWTLCGEFTGDRWIPRTKGQQRGKCFHLMTSSWHFKNPY